MFIYIQNRMLSLVYPVILVVIAFAAGVASASEMANADETDVANEMADNDYVTADTDMKEISIVDPAWNKFEIGPELFIYQYEEPGFVKLDGTLYGIDGRFTRYIPRKRKVTVGRGEDAVVTEKDYMIVLRIDGRYAMGTHDYVGALWNGTPKTMNGIDATSYEFRCLIGYSAQAQQDRMTVFYGGLGTRFKDDDSSFDPAGYKRESSYKYVPLLIEHTRTLNNGNKLACTFEYDFFFAGEQISYLSAIKIKNKQESGNGFRASVAYSGTTATGRGWKIEPFFRSWDIDDSEKVYLSDGRNRAMVLEPKNNTLELGISARFVF